RIAQPLEIKYLYPMIAGSIGNDEYVILVDLHVAPDRNLAAFGHGELAEIARIVRVADVNKRSAIRATNYRVFATRERIGPAPDVVGPHAPLAPDVLYRQERQHVDILAREGCCCV